MGSRNLAIECLKLIERTKHEIMGIIVPEDDFETHWYSSTAKFAKNRGHSVYSPTSVNDVEFVRSISRLNPDIGISIFYSQILKKRFIDIFPQGIVNLHFAPLPRYRGCAPITWAIMNGEKYHGVTIHFVDEGIDAGNIILQQKVRILNDDTAFDLYKKCEKVGLKLFKRFLNILGNKKIESFPQDNNEAVIYYRKNLKNFELDLNWDEKRKWNFIRALTFPPQKPAFITIGNKKAYIIAPIKNQK